MSTRSIETVEELRRLYREPNERAVRKQLARLDRHCRRFIELSPFVVVATGSGDSLDASPRGGAPGFVRVVDDLTLWIPDAPGNNRLDSLANIVATGQAGLLFLIPGVDETLRVNGRAAVSADPEKLWAADARADREVLPSMGEMLAEQTSLEGTPESQAEMIARYQRDL